MNGKPGDHPVTDMLLHGMHPFPQDIEELLREILTLTPDFPDDLRFCRYYSEQLLWERRIGDLAAGRNMEEGREALKKLLEQLRREDQGMA